MRPLGSTRGRAASFALALLAGSAVHGASPAGAQVFSDQTDAQGVAFTHHPLPGDKMPMGAGGAWGDYDNDGDLDLYVADTYGPNRLFRNEGGGAGFVDVAADLGVDDTDGAGTGALFGDYDNDGDADLYVLNRGASRMFRNDGPGGDGGWVFTDVTTQIGVECFGRSASAVYGDYDGDGWLDLYVGNHNYSLELPVDGEPFREDCLFHSVVSGGARVFENVASRVFDPAVLAISLNHSAGFLDYDDDGDLDLYVVNNGEEHTAPEITGDNLLFRNDGSDGRGGWTFTDVTALSGAALRELPMGLAIGDYNNDGRLDMATSNVGPNYLFQNQGGRFVDRAAHAGVDRPILPEVIGFPVGFPQVSWGVVMFDADLDGWEDLYFATGWGDPAMTPPQRNPFFHNDGNPPDNTFTDVSATSGTDDPQTGRTVVKGDYDGDGDEDLYLVNYAGDARLFRNDQTGGTFLALRLHGSVSNRDAIGARVRVRVAGLPDQHRMVQSGSTTGGSNDPTLVFGLGGATHVDSVVVDWPSGSQTTPTHVAAGLRLDVVEDESPPVTQIHEWLLNGATADRFSGPPFVLPDPEVLGPTGLSLVGGGNELGPSVSLAFLDPAEWSIELRLTLFHDDVGHQKLIDFKDRTADFGLYVYDDSLVFHDEGDSDLGEPSFTAGVPFQVVLTRSSSGRVTGYMDGVESWSFDDGVEQKAVFSAGDNIAHFLRDEGGGQSHDAFLDSVRIWDGALPAADVLALSVPEPFSTQLGVSALLGLAALRRRRPEIPSPRP